MTAVVYRPYREVDAPRVKEMIDEAFHVHRYAGAKRLLDSALEVYLRECLVASTYAQVAVHDGRVVGVVMGRVNGGSFLSRRLRNRMRAWAHTAKIVLTGWGHLRSLSQHLGFERVYAKLRKDVDGPLADELTLFVVDSDTRGLGVGKALYREFTEHLREAGRDEFYLYTDSLCTFQFYEKRGMARAAGRDMPLSVTGLPSSVGVYLYTGSALAAT